MEIVPVEEVGELAVGAGLLVAGSLWDALDELAAGGPGSADLGVETYFCFVFPVFVFRVFPYGTFVFSRRRISDSGFPFRILEITSALDLAEKEKSEALDVVEGLVCLGMFFQI